MTLVSRCYQYAAIVLLVLWVPAALHCRLELIPAVSFLSCCQHPEKDKTPAHHDDDCANDGCAAFESGLYHLEKAPEMLLKPALELVIFMVPVPTEIPERPEFSPVSGDLSPPDLPMTWQFRTRAVGLARAPSFTS